MYLDFLHVQTKIVGLKGRHFGALLTNIAERPL